MQFPADKLAAFGAASLLYYAAVVAHVARERRRFGESPATALGWALLWPVGMLGAAARVTED